MPAIAFIGPAYEARSPAVANDRLVNLFPEVYEVPRTARTEVAAFYTVPGITPFCGLGAPIRGMLTTTVGRCFVVAGSTLHEVFGNGTFGSLGTLATGAGPVSMSENGAQLLVVDGPHGYILTLAGNVFTPITDEGFQGATHAVFVDGFFGLNRPGTGQWYISGLYDGLSYDATDIVTAESSPDPIVAMVELKREIWTIGTRSTEVWFNQGLADFPFVRIPGATHQEGTIAPQSVVRLGSEGLAWLGQGEQGYGIVWRTQGYQLQRISTHAIETAIREAADPTAAFAWCHHLEGHLFYVLTVGDRTWSYDVATQLWHERAQLDAHGHLQPLPLRSHCTAFRQALVGGDVGIVYRLDTGLYDYDGLPMPRIRQWQPVASGDRNALFHHELEITMETGVGLEADGHGHDPQIMLQWSNDHGRTWSSERWKHLGRRGEYGVQVAWHRLGSAIERVYRVQVDAPVNIVLTGAHLRATGATT
jgi:hypothetical protein